MQTESLDLVQSISLDRLWFSDSVSRTFPFLLLTILIFCAIDNYLSRMWGCLNREIYVGQTRLLDARYLRGGAHCGNVVVLILSANTAAVLWYVGIWLCIMCLCHRTFTIKASQWMLCSHSRLGCTLNARWLCQGWAYFTFLQKRTLLDRNFEISELIFAAW